MNKAVHIVNTRKYDEDKRAIFGRNGDTTVRTVAGQDSHVTAFEAYMIDVNGRAAEDMVKRNGAGTLNPITSMPEYHGFGEEDYERHWHMDYEEDPPKLKSHGSTAAGEGMDGEGVYDWPAYSAVDVDGNPWGDQSERLEEVDAAITSMSEVDTTDWDSTSLGSHMTAYDNLLANRQAIVDYTRKQKYEGYDYDALSEGGIDAITEYAKEEFDVNIGGYEDYITAFDSKKLGFIEEEADLANQRSQQTFADTTQDLSIAQSRARGTSMDQMTQLGTSAGRQFLDASTQANQTMAQTGMEFSGTLSSQMNLQKNRILSDYETGISGIQKNLANIQADTALGMQRAGESLALDQLSTDLGLRKGLYTEKDRQMDELHDEILAVEAAK